jgi:hypothetical protein
MPEARQDGRHQSKAFREVREIKFFSQQLAFRGSDCRKSFRDKPALTPCFARFESV